MAKIKYYVSQSTGQRHLISAMDSNYLYNARNKLKRTVYTNMTKNGDLEVSKRGENTELYKALDNELQKRNSIDYLPPIIKYKRSNS
tara:strand:+ start:13475 stop:13735 length:261 start_codon:yes stop_codon:yes gene_type:complete